MSEEKKFLKASDPETWAKPDDVTWGDHFLRPDKPLNQRQRELARLAAHGKTNNEICKLLDYTQGRVSVLLSNTKVKNEIEKYKDKLFGVDAQTRLKELSGDALNVMEGILIDGQIDIEKKESAAKWVLEKTTGKAAQQIEVKGEVNIGVFLDKLDQLKSTNKSLPAPEPIDVTPLENEDGVNQEPKEKTPEPAVFDDWLDKNF